MNINSVHKNFKKSLATLILVYKCLLLIEVSSKKIICYLKSDFKTLIKLIVSTKKNIKSLILNNSRKLHSLCITQACLNFKKTKLPQT